MFHANNNPVHDLDIQEQDMLYTYLASQPLSCRFLITFYLETGIRCSEGLAITLESARTALKLKTPTLFISTLKKGKTRKLIRPVPIRTKPAHPNHDFSLYTLLLDWLEMRKLDPDNYTLITSPYGEIRRSAKQIHRTTAFRCVRNVLMKVGLYDHCLHDLRHTFAINFLRRGGSLPVLSKILGHDSLQATSVYVQPRRENIEKEMNL